MLPEPENTSGSKPANSSEIIDIVHLDQYTLGDQGLQKELLQLFRIQLKDQVNELMACASEINWKSACHLLKGASRAVGAWQISQIAEALEEASFEDDANRAALLSKLLSAKARFEAEVLQYV